jgi:hypothetical protein
MLAITQSYKIKVSKRGTPKKYLKKILKKNKKNELIIVLMQMPSLEKNLAIQFLQVKDYSFISSKLSQKLQTFSDHIMN